jgi:glycosyltransferase involved in cell wall biosynthesis
VRISDPGYRYTGEVARAAVLVGESQRYRHGPSGALVLELARHLPVDVYDVDSGELHPDPWASSEDLGGHQHLSQVELHAEVARHRACVHTSPSSAHGLTLLEVMHLGLPVVPLMGARTRGTVVSGARAVAADAEAMIAATRRLLTDPDAARELGRYARRAALARHGVEHFLADWENVLVRDEAA